MGVKRESERETLRGTGREEGPQTGESAWRKRMESVRPEGGIRGVGGRERAGERI